ncbi:MULTISPECIES: hypothetical protein [Streptomyces]|uniref:FXSXX-COOH protein n=1 Tax=Streptomyces doudnae TaxID=3075536 RepID=A0ABD5EMP2_9ACTN|nr:MULTISPECIES: hypothetical protein [unclassified Streptomyces]MDT0435649.1 hypothetical protein [Streptomyces sp. DSM 41981]MYQ62603.1 hypothetical protein [Streptomyces sp. SID4950]SCD40642.1 hypothetical protein GA0115242_1048108 [Streptomyces sp. SolWspMP-5a-2]
MSRDLGPVDLTDVVEDLGATAPELLARCAADLRNSRTAQQQRETTGESGIREGLLPGNSPCPARKHAADWAPSTGHV